jgi:hypothetical protein
VLKKSREAIDQKMSLEIQEGIKTSIAMNSYKKFAQNSFFPLVEMT